MTRAEAWAVQVAGTKAPMTWAGLGVPLPGAEALPHEDKMLRSQCRPHGATESVDSSGSQMCPARKRRKKAGPQAVLWRRTVLPSLSLHVRSLVPGFRMVSLRLLYILSVLRNWITFFFSLTDLVKGFLPSSVNFSLCH